MSKKKTRLKGPWQTVQLAIWLFGLAILFSFDWIWPGILVLVAISALTQAAIQRLVPDVVEEEKPEAETLPPVQPTVEAKPATVEYPIHRLPSECPKCAGPIRGQEVRWTSPYSADCPYCGANLPLKE